MFPILKPAGPKISKYSPTSLLSPKNSMSRITFLFRNLIGNTFVNMICLFMASYCPVELFNANNMLAASLEDGDV